VIDGLDPLPPLGRFVADLLMIEADMPGQGALVEQLTVEMPVEIDLLAGGGTVLACGASPPTQRIETSILPVFHRLRVTLAATTLADEEADDAGDER